MSLLSPLGDFFKKGKNKEEKPQAQESTPPPASLSRLLSSGTILICTPPEKKSELLKSMVRKICAANTDIPLERAFQAVMEREKVTTTFMDNGIAVPHARLKNLSQIVASLAILPEGFAAQKNTLAKQPPQKEPSKTFFVFLFLSPEGALAAHLQVLSKASWLFQNSSLKEHLLKSESPDQVLDLIKKAENQPSNGPATQPS